jgi:hypothetical protein
MDVGHRAESWGGGLVGRKGGRVMKEVPLSEVKDQLSRYLRVAERDEVGGAGISG